MLFQQALSVLALLGLASAVAVKREEDRLQFNIKFKDGAGYRETNNFFQDAPDSKIKREDWTKAFTWGLDELGTARAKRYFKLYTYDDDDDAVDKPKTTFMCTLEGLETQDAPDITGIHEYTLDGDDRHPLDLLIRHDEARLSCFVEGDVATGPFIDTASSIHCTG